MKSSRAGLAALLLLVTGVAALPAYAQVRPVPHGRYDVEEGVLRAAYRISPSTLPSATPEATALRYLAAEADAFGWDGAADDLRVADVQHTPHSSHVTFQQTYAGLPVHNRQVKVSLDRTGQPSMVVSGYAPHLRTSGLDPAPTLSADEATARARALAGTPLAEASAPELVVYPSKRPRLAWRTVARPAARPAEWEILVDAHSGELIDLVDLSTHGAEKDAGPGRPSMGVQPPDGARPDDGRTARRPTLHATRRLADGSGLVFDPDPLTTAGVSYGGAYVDGDDADSEALRAQRRDVPLLDITRGTDGLYRLEGPYVHVDGSAEIGGTESTVPLEARPDGFRYTRADPRFEAVMTYFHIDKSARHVASLDVGHTLPTVRVNPHGLGTEDNSRYYPNQNAIAFGDGGIDDAEDADVIWHEYAHALMNASAPGLLSAREGDGRALHEGWADYWAASYARSLAESAAAVPDDDWRYLYTWDGNTEGWSGRDVDHPGHYPDRMEYEGGRGAALPVDYQHGLLWATTLMEIYPAVGRTVMDRLTLASHLFLSPTATFRDAAEALLQADHDLYDGAHTGLLIDVLGERGFLDAGAYGPILGHEPLAATEQIGGTRTIVVEAAAGAAPVDTVLVFYGFGTAPTRELVLEPLGDGRYGGALPLPAGADTVRYFVEAVDAEGRSAWLPADAPWSVYRFYAGPDHAPPVLRHDPLPEVALPGWPLTVTAEAEDALGIDSVWVAYTVAGPGGAPKAEGLFGLDAVAAGAYTGSFAATGQPAEPGTTVHYRLFARDASRAGNVAVLPESGTFTTEVVAAGPLRAYDFEGVEEAFSATGSWAHGRPTYGLRVAHSGERVWATAPGAKYPAQTGRSRLDLPPFSLEGIGGAYLVFWHWYDVEHGGGAAPGTSSGDASLWDGGNVKVSTDGGRTWTVAEPEGGYTGVVDARYGNPLGGEPAFGGYSYGWRREVVPLPAAPEVRVRFDFGTDSSNEDMAHYFAGWYIDDVTITTRVPADETPPEVLAAPPLASTRPAGHSAPPLLVRAVDDTGIEAALVDYAIETADGVEEGTVRLAMSEADANAFTGALPTQRVFAVGDRITWRLHLRDFAGNETVYPAPSEAPITVEYMLTQTADALADLRPTGLWGREGQSWATQPDADAPPRSSLVLAPIDLPENADELLFSLQHRYRLGDGLGGNVKISVDGGASWTVLTPREGYPATLPADHPMRGEAAFTGAEEAGTTVSFDLGPYAGRQVRLRIDFGATRALAGDELWTVQQAELSYATREEGFETPRTLTLHPNFPDPFATTTTVSYTLPELLPVRLAVFDLLGRRVAVIVHAEQPAGTYTHTFDGSRLASGVYLLRLEAGDRQQVERMVVVR